MKKRIISGRGAKQVRISSLLIQRLGLLPRMLFMALPPYTRTREGEVPQLGSGPTPCRLGLAVRKASPPF